MATQQSLIRVRVWDLPTRLFHWALALCFSGSLITGTVGGAAMAFHFRFGYAMLALLLFRFVWGLVGGRWSRFSSFLFSPQATLAYLKGESPIDARVGHSPLAALSVWALLAFLTLQVATGLVSDDEIFYAGPLTHMVSNATVRLATFYHADFGQLVLLALVLLHLGAVVYHTRRRQRLVSAMLHGDKLLPPSALPSRDDAKTRLLAIVILVLCGTTAYGVSSLRAALF
jgi:cytochrome b